MSELENKQGKCGFVAIIGAPNAGKSTLVNHYVGTKVSIVSPKVQTTRTQVKGIAIKDDAQIIFIDTPGIFKPKRRLDRAMVSSAWGGFEDADLVYMLIDAKRGLDDESVSIIENLQKSGKKASLVFNKIDLVSKEALLELTRKVSEFMAFEDIFMVSAQKADGMDELLDNIISKLPDGIWLYPEDQVSDMPLRLLAAEITREKLFYELHQELPYSLTVETELWEGREDGSVRLEQTIYTAKEGHKSMILGKGGQMIKKIGSSARRELEELTGLRVHLFLFVKVRDNWENSPERYREWGLDFNA